MAGYFLLMISMPTVWGGVQHFRGPSGNGGFNSANNGGRNMIMKPTSPNMRLINSAGSFGNTNLVFTNGPMPDSPSTPMRPRLMFPPRVPFTCTLFVDSGYFCPSGYPRPSTQYFYNPFTQTCETFYYRGCGGTPNRFSSRGECLRGCGCFSDIDSGGSCPNVFPRYTLRYAFNQYSGTCQPFRFSECTGGNDNNFSSQLECQTTCGPLDNFNGPIYPFNGMSRMATGNQGHQDFSSTVNMRSHGNDGNSQTATEGLTSNSGSTTNFGSSSIMAIERPSHNFNSRVMGFPAFQTNFGSSAIPAGNTPYNRRLNTMPSPINPGLGPMSLYQDQIGLETGSGRTQNGMFPGKIY